MSILRVENLHVHYGHIHAIKGISLAVDEGNIVTIIGTNGAGKSTLLNTISGLKRPTEGSIYFKDREISGARAEEVLQAGIAQIPEGRKIFRELSVEENLLVGAYTIDDKAKQQELLERSYSIFPQLANKKRQNGATLSGGEQQMLAIGRGLMSDPEVIMFDEPSLGLAPYLVDNIFDFIMEIKDLGKSILLVEQNANIALNVASYGYVLETGRITTEDTSANLRSSDMVRRAYLGVS